MADTRFADSDGVNIAYQVVGDGRPDILAFSSAVLPIDSIDDEPLLARFHRRLASFGREIRFDLRGVGMSDPVSLSEPPTLEQWVRDAIAVLDAVGSERAIVFAPRDASLHGLLLAASFPARVASLILFNGTARMARADDYAVGIPAHLLDRFVDVNMQQDASVQGFDFLTVAAPSVARNDAFRAWWVKAGYRGASPATARAIQSVYIWADVRAILPAVRAPTLVLHRRANEMVRVGHGRYLAEHIPEVKYVELDGADDLYWVGDTDAVLDEIEEFVTGERRGAGADRTLATILFTDIVGSTERVSAIGDRAWHELLDRHDEMLRRQLTRFGGREVKTTGDGVLAVFDGPARALMCACAMRDGAAQLGIALRIGIHTGEVEARGDDVTGVAVHIAARVEALGGANEFLVSRTVVDLVVGSGMDFEDRGNHMLKGIPGEWRIFAVVQ